LKLEERAHGRKSGLVSAKRVNSTKHFCLAELRTKISRYCDN
jgi:hypothetical protein